MLKERFPMSWAQDIVDSCERFFPRTLPTVLSRMLQGEMIVEPLEVWPEI